MAKQDSVDKGSLSFRDRSLSKAAASELLTANSSRKLSGIIGVTVAQIRDAKTARAGLATEAEFANRREGQNFIRSAAGGQFLSLKSFDFRGRKKPA